MRIVLAACWWLAAATAMAGDGGPYVKITAVNGETLAGPAPALTVRPGDVITLSADVVTQGGGCRRESGCAQNRYIEEFSWTADDRPGDECHPARQKDCLSASSFQLNNYGVSFYVPQNMGNELRISVTDATTDGTDTILLVNAAPPVVAVPRTEEVTAPPPASAPPEVQPSVTTYDTMLVGQGRWVYISSTRYWVPYTYQANWVPYQNGYWTWVEGDGWTWISYDPWGAYTDHYGIWRHHLEYGWVWLPFEHPRYVAATVSWFYGPSHIGWYPYYPGYGAAYRHGYRQGFNDGYWVGYHTAQLRSNTASFTFGLTAVHNVEFAAKNVKEVRVDSSTATTLWTTSAAAGRLAPTPGSQPIGASKVWMEQRIGEPVPTTHVKQVQVGGGSLKVPEPIRPVPEGYQHLAQPVASKAIIPVGSMVMDRGDKTRVVPPTANGMALTHPPSMPKGSVATPPPRTKFPAVPHQDHPYAQRSKLPKMHGPVHQGKVAPKPYVPPHS